MSYDCELIKVRVHSPDYDALFMPQGGVPVTVDFQPGIDRTLIISIHCKEIFGHQGILVDVQRIIADDVSRTVREGGESRTGD